MYSSSYSYDDGWSEEDQPSPKEAFLDVEGIVVLIATCMSLLGSSITVATFVLFKDMRSSSLTFALWLAAASIGYSLLTFLKPFDDNRFVCEFVAFFTTYCNLVAVFTATVVAYGMLRIFSFRDALTVPSQRSFNIIRKRYYAYGKNPGTYSCWIVVNDNWKDFDNAWKLVFFGFVLLAVCFTSYVFVYIFNKFSNVRERSSEVSNKIIEAIDRVKWYPIILIAVYIIPCAASILSVAGVKFDFTLWNSFSVSSLKIQGFLNALAYGMTPVVRYRWNSFVYGTIANKADLGVELPLAANIPNSSITTPGHRKSNFDSRISSNVNAD